MKFNQQKNKMDTIEKRKILHQANVMMTWLRFHVRNDSAIHVD